MLRTVRMGSDSITSRRSSSKPRKRCICCHGEDGDEVVSHHDDTLPLFVDSEPVASGYAEDPLQKFSYQTPRCQKQGEEYVVTSASGEHLRTYPTRAAVFAAFTQIKYPFIPTQITYHDRLKLQAKDASTNQLVRYYPT